MTSHNVDDLRLRALTSSVSLSLEPLLSKSLTKWYTPCLPGRFPVMNVLQAAAVIGGMLEYNAPQPPLARSRPRWGNVPSRIHGSSTSQVAPSRPITNTRFDVCIEILRSRSVRTARRPARYIRNRRYFQ